MNITRVKKWIGVCGVLLLIIILFGWLYSHSTIEISVANPDLGVISYKLTNQSDGKITTITSHSAHVKKRVHRGVSEILVSQNQKNYFAIVKTGGFLATTKVNASLLAEKSRAFVGDSPAPCLFYTDQLYSYECGATVGDINLHVSASSNQPTYTQKGLPAPLEGSVEGLAKTSKGNIALLHPFDSEGTGGHVAYLLDNNLKPLKTTALVDLASDVTYTVTAYKSGFLVYDTSFTKLVYYASLDAQPETIAIKKPTVSGLQPLALSASGEAITLLYSNSSGDVGESGAAVKKIKNTVLIYNQGSSKELNFDNEPLSTAILCGTDRLCVLSGVTLSVYDTTGQKKSLLYSVSGVKDVGYVGSSLIVVRGSEILALDVGSLTASVDYSLGDYQFCGLKASDTNSYLLCVIGGSKKSALLVNRAQDNKDSIDKKVSQLRKLPKTADVSVYGQFIFVTPDLGQMIYDSASKGYDYPQGPRDAASQNIDKAAESLGLTTAGFRVIDTIK